ncbi:hypothetical protein A4X06_0g8835 [Tilletia controversa]|uniref:Reverse transcriptase n=1 Tax=Tilletia controversa TaxID=13291 RepID=A0A8X7SSS7_9BASI|nr:hypothetical protein A4X06_0g8835 [Tilletia controversa]
MVHGLGNIRTLGWTTIVTFIEATDEHGNSVHMEFTQDFHVLPLFSPGLCLGLDFITTHAVTLMSASSTASIGHYSFPVVERVSGPYALRPEIHAAEEVTLLPGRYSWIPVYAGCLAPGVDYYIHPRMSVSDDEAIQLAGPVGLLTHNPRRHILLGNFGHVSGEAFTLDAESRLTEEVAPPVVESVGDPINPFDDEDPGPSDLAREAETVLVDDHFRVGVDADGVPPAAVVELLRTHTDAFALDGRPGRIHDPEMGEMPIDLLPDAALRPEAPRRASPEKRRAMDSAIDQLLEWDVIESSTSPVSFPVLMVRQRDKWRFCVDYRQLNSSTVSDRYPLPTIDSIFQTLTGKRVFSSLDAIRGYHQMGVKEADRWKTAFVCHRGLYQYKTVPFGLKNAPSVFQRMMDRILGALRWSHAVVYIDDIVVASTSIDEHVEALGILLANATRAGLKFSPSKCTFAVPSLVLLGRKVSGAGVAVWKDRAKAVSDLARPTTLRELYHVLGLFGYYRAFVKRFAELASPLTQLTRGWKYSAGSDGRYRLTNTEDPNRPFVLYVDASKDAFAAILHQVFDEPATPRLQTMQSAVHHAMPVGLLPPEIAKERWCSWLRSDRHFAPIMHKVEEGSDDDEWALSDGLLVRRIDDRLAIPEAAIPEILKSVHDRRGHFGFLKTYLAVSRNFWRPSLSVAVRSWVKHCSVFLRTKRLPKVGSLDVDHDPQFPFHTISLDLLFGLHRTRAGNDAVLVILDVFSRMILLQPCSSSVTAEGIAAIISDRVLRWGWRPRRLMSDSEARMTGSVMSTLAKSLRAELTPSPPHHQQANAVERAIQTAQQVLQAMGVEDRAHWDRRLLPTVELAMNATPSLVAGFRPLDLVFVHHPDVVHAVFDSGDQAGVLSFADRLAVADERLQDARIAIQAARTEQKRRYDKRRQPIPLFAVASQCNVRFLRSPV